VIEVLRAAELIDDLDVVLPRFRDAIEEGILVDRAFDAAFCRRPIIADDLDDQCVVGVRKLRHGIEHASDLVIDMGAIAGEDFHHPRIEAFLVGIE
jgi:hypothetical protein